MPDPLDYQSPDTPSPASPERVLHAAVIVFITVLFVNLFIGSQQIAQDSIGREVLIGPLANIVILLTALCLQPIVRRLARSADVGGYIFASTVFPLLAIPMELSAVGRSMCCMEALFPCFVH